MFALQHSMNEQVDQGGKQFRSEAHTVTSPYGFTTLPADPEIGRTGIH
jgi:hypothetical protein